MKLDELGINPATGGAVVVISGQVMKNEPWEINQPGQPIKTGHSFHVAYFGGTLKVQTNSDHPLRKFQPGDQVDFSLPVSDTSGKGFKQNGPPIILVHGDPPKSKPSS